MPPKPDRIMTCWMCPRYLRETHRCQDGKTNPKKKTDTVAVVETLGLRALCHYNPYRDAIALRMHFPKDSATVELSRKKTKSKRDADFSRFVVKEVSTP